MSGNTHGLVQILGASTVAVGGAAALPETGLPVFASVMIATGAVLATVLVLRFIRVIRTAK